MTKVYLLKASGNTVGFSLCGHANFSKNGEPDILCSAISMASQMTIMGIEDVVCHEVKVETNEDEGYLHAVFANDSCNTGVKALVRAFELGMKDLSEQYPDNIRIQEIFIS